MTMPLLPFNFKAVVSETLATALGSSPSATNGAESSPANAESFAVALQQAVAAQPTANAVAPAPLRHAAQDTASDSAPFGGGSRKRRDDGRAPITEAALGARVAPTIAMDLVTPALLAPSSTQGGPSPTVAESSSVMPNEPATLAVLVHPVLTEEALANAGADNANVSGDEPVFVPLEAPGEVRSLPIGDVHKLPIIDVPADPGRIQRDPGALADVFRGRLGRVVDRMRDEFGYKVEIVEAVRTPTRQAALYARGRTEPGQVVTWTLDSKHLSGHAADLRIDGRYDNPLAFARLAAVAQEEGLQTLGARDPGHIELPSVAGGARGDMGSARNVGLPAEPNPQGVATPDQNAQVVVTQTPRGIATVARVAEVARVATVARIATVATVATVAGGSAQQPAPRSTANRVASGAHGNGESRLAERDPARDASAPRTARIAGAHGDASALALATARAAEHGLTSMGESAGTDLGAARSIDMSERVAAILDVHNRSQDRPVSSLLLRLEHPELGEDRLRVDLRNNSVGATLDVANSRAADQLNAHISDLRRALEAQGLETDHLTIRHAARAAEAAAPIAEREAMRGMPLPPDSTVLGSLGARENVSSARSSSRSSDHQQQTPDQRQQRGRKDPQGGR